MIFKSGSDGFHSVDTAFVSFDDLLDLFKVSGCEWADNETEDKDKCLRHLKSIKLYGPKLISNLKIINQLFIIYITAFLLHLNKIEIFERFQSESNLITILIQKKLKKEKENKNIRKRIYNIFFWKYKLIFDP